MMAVLDGKIVHIGNASTIKAWLGSSTQVLDAEGLSVYPGFIDTHVHVFEGTSEIGADCELDPELTLGQQLPQLQECAEYFDSPSQWLIGDGYQLDALLSGNTPLSPRNVLDDIFPANPVIIMEESSHSMWVDSRALQLAGIDEASEHPVGGRLMYKTGSNTLNGILFANACDIVTELAWNVQQRVMQRSYNGLLTCSINL